MLIVVEMDVILFQNIPFMPPPPPPMGEDGMDEDGEAMCSMLMAWYMSGYHTGYYQVRQMDYPWSGTPSLSKCWRGLPLEWDS